MKFHGFAIVLLMFGCTTPSIVATQLIQKGDEANNENRYTEAIEYYENYLRTSPELGIYRSPQMESEVCRKLAHAYSTQGNYTKAIERLNQASVIDSTASSSLALIEDYRLLGLVHAYIGDYKASISHFTNSISLGDRLSASIKDTRRSLIGRTYISLAQVHLAIGNFDSANEFALKAHALYASIKDGSIGVGESLLIQGIVARELNNLDDALKFVMDSKRIAVQNNLNTSSQDQALGEINFLRGEFEDGLRNKLDAINQALRTNIKPQIIQAYMRLGDAYRQLGDEKRATEYYDKALQVQEGIDENKSAASFSLDLRSGDIDHAYDFYAKSGSTMGLALVCLRKAQLLSSSDNPDSILHYATLAKTYFSKAGSKEGIARANIELAKLETKTGGLIRGLELLDSAQAQTIQKDLLWQIFFRRGVIYEESGKFSLAFKAYNDAIEIIENMRGNLSIDELKIVFSNTKTEVYDKLILLVLRHHKNLGASLLKESVESYSFELNEKARSRAFLDMLGNKKVSRKSIDDTLLLAKEQRIRVKIRQLNKELSNASKREHYVTLRNELSDSQAEYNEVISEIKLKSPAYSSVLTVSQSSLQEIQNTLRPEAAIVEYWVSNEELVIWVIKKDGINVRRVSVDKTSLIRESKRCRNAISLQLTEVETESLTILSSWLYHPIKDLVATCKSLVVVPHNALHFIPFHALLYNDNEYLTERFVISYSPSASSFVYCSQMNVNKGNKMLALALGDHQIGSHQRLPGTETEVSHVSKVFLNADLKTRSEFSETFVKRSLSEYDYIHLATHGIFNSHQPLYSYILMSGSANDDGRLTVGEIFDLQLNSRLVALSACETALGDINEGDEMIGLSRAFIYAGSPVVLVSLWKVDDVSTSLLMTRFYQYLESGRNPGESLTFAQRDILDRKFSISASGGIKAIDFDDEVDSALKNNLSTYSTDPYYWAPFILIGAF